MDNQQLEKINKFTRYELTADEVYVFSVILCDNDIDRGGERFSDKALEELQKLFIGKTGIFDHDPKSSNQNARIFDTEIMTDNSRTTVYGAPYKCLKASAYMVRTDENLNLIAEIDGGIKKEVSISCTASQRICSICGCDKNKASCAHVKGKMYGNKLCHTVLGGITDAYEWSFVAVPAHVIEKDENRLETNDINHPNHYQGKYECIDEMIALFGVDEVKAFCRCNVYKYRFRAGRKVGERVEKDLGKAEWYMDKLMELNKDDYTDSKIRSMTTTYFE